MRWFDGTRDEHKLVDKLKLVKNFGLFVVHEVILQTEEMNYELSQTLLPFIVICEEQKAAV